MSPVETNCPAPWIASRDEIDSALDILVSQVPPNAGTLNTKFIPVLWPPAGKEQIPLVLRGATR